MMGILIGVLRLIPVIVTAIQTVERISDKKGKDKQDAAIGAVGDLIPLIEGSISKEVVNEAAVQDAIRKVIDAIVALHNVAKDVLAKRSKQQ